MHTPGSWHVNAIARARIIGDETAKGWEKLQINAANKTVATVYHGPDARLIATAPDLLAALRDAAFLLRKVAINPREAGRMADSLNRSADEAVAAIAKAEGRTP